MDSNWMRHKWSGWPGAWCLDCGVECLIEAAICCQACQIHLGPEDTFEEYLCSDHTQEACKHPGEDLANPYKRKEN